MDIIYIENRYILVISRLYNHINIIPPERVHADTGHVPPLFYASSQVLYIQHRKIARLYFGKVYYLPALSIFINIHVILIYKIIILVLILNFEFNLYFLIQLTILIMFSIYF